MAWDRDRPVPWKRLFTFIGIYSLIVFGLFAVLQPDRLLQSLPGLAFGAGVALAIMALLSKFGWQPTMLKSKDQIAADRAERQAARTASASGKGGKSAKGAKDDKGSEVASSAAPAAPRAKPAPTRRTTTGPTNNPRRTRDTRKR